MRTAAPPQVVWEFLTAPGRRKAWQPGVTDVIAEAKGNRLGVGATNHCMHGDDAIVEEILDWRPFDYYTDRSTMQTPAGPVTFLTTSELEPTADGTIVRMRFGPTANRSHRSRLEQMAPMLEAVVEEGGRILREQLDAETESRMADRGVEPDVPAPGPHAPFAGVGPIAYR
jgi:uncharacterized protein YndB with AHSA1/START domain